MIPHLYFRRQPYQRFLRCLTPGCGYVARTPGSHVAHANGRTRDEVALDD